MQIDRPAASSIISYNSPTLMNDPLKLDTSDDSNVHVIGCMKFSIGKTKNKMHPIKLFDDFYAQPHHENSTAEGAQTQLTLERIHLIHYSYIVSTSQ
jgi:hypothetical protein